MDMDLNLTQFVGTGLHALMKFIRRTPRPALAEQDARVLIVMTAVQMVREIKILVHDSVLPIIDHRAKGVLEVR